MAVATVVQQGPYELQYGSHCMYGFFLRRRHVRPWLFASCFNVALPQAGQLGNSRGRPYGPAEAWTLSAAQILRPSALLGGSA